MIDTNLLKPCLGYNESRNTSNQTRVVTANFWIKLLQFNKSNELLRIKIHFKYCKFIITLDSD